MSYRFKTVAFFLLLAFAAGPALAAAEKPLLAQHPSLSRTQIVFAYAGDLWLAGRDGGPAARLTTGVGIESDPALLARRHARRLHRPVRRQHRRLRRPGRGRRPPPADPPSGRRRGRRLDARRQAHPLPLGADERHPASRRSSRSASTAASPRSCRCPTGVSGSFSADGSRLAYVPTMQWQAAWKRYHGGQTTPIWIVVARRPQGREDPPRELQRLEPDVGRRQDLLPLRPQRPGLALRLRPGDEKGRPRPCRTTGSTSSRPRPAPGGIVVEQFGALHLFDPATGTARPHLGLPRRATCPRSGRTTSRSASASPRPRISPNGARAVFEARGEILTVPAEKGDIRNLTRTTGVMERDPSWSPDGKSIAYFSDESGEYALHIRDQAGQGPVEEDRSRRAAVVLLQARLVARQQEDRLQRQAPDPLVRRYRQGRARQGRHDLLLSTRRSPSISAGRRTAAG